MAYENTHLWAADVIRRRFKNIALKKLINNAIDHYYLGAVFPDVLYYSNYRQIKDIASFLHGEAGTPCNKVVFEVIDRLKCTRDNENLAFILGFITHLAIDIVWHPIVFYFSGFRAGMDSKKQMKSAYLHWHFETCIDRRFNNSHFIDKLIRPEVVNDLIIDSILNISKQAILVCINNQISYFRRTHSLFFYVLYKILAGIGIVDTKYLGGFYLNLHVDRRRIPENFNYKNPISGENRHAALDDLMKQGVTKGTRMVQSAYDYYRGEISRQDCAKIVVGNNLYTGQLGRVKADIKFSLG